MVIGRQENGNFGNPDIVSVQQRRRCAEEAGTLYAWYADQADDKADAVLLGAYGS